MRTNEKTCSYALTRRPGATSYRDNCSQDDSRWQVSLLRPHKGSNNLEQRTTKRASSARRFLLFHTVAFPVKLDQRTVCPTKSLNFRLRRKRWLYGSNRINQAVRRSGREEKRKRRKRGEIGVQWARSLVEFDVVRSDDYKQRTIRTRITVVERSFVRVERCMYIRRP